MFWFNNIRSKSVTRIYAEFINMFHTLHISSTSCNGFGKMPKEKLCGETVGIIQ